MTDLAAGNDHAELVPLGAVPRVSEASVADYVGLLKPRVMTLVVFTAIVGLAVAPGHLHPVL